MPRGKDRRGRQQVARASGRTVELATQRALAELDFAPGELADDQYEVTIVIPPEEGFMGVGAVDAVVEVALVGEDFDFYGPENDAQPEELLDDDYADEEDEDDDGLGDGVGRELRWVRGRHGRGQAGCRLACGISSSGCCGRWA